MVWWPTCEKRSSESEKRMFDPVRTPYRQIMVDIGPDPEGRSNPKDDHLVNTFLFDPPTTSPDTPLETLVLAHGFGSGSGFWSRNLDALCETHRVVLFDWLGFGRSSRPRFRTGLGPAASEAWFVSSLHRWAQCLSALGSLPPRFVLAGHSMGGFLSAGFAMRHPEWLSGLVLLSPVGLPQFPGEDSLTRLPRALRLAARATHALGLSPQSYLRLAGPAGPSVIRRTRRHMVRKFDGFYDDPGRTVLDYSYHVNVARASGETAFFQIVNAYAFARLPLVERAAALEIPTVLMYGGGYDWMDSAAGEEFAARMSVFARVCKVPDAGHNLFADNPSAFNDLFSTAVQEVVAHTASLRERGAIPSSRKEYSVAEGSDALSGGSIEDPAPTVQVAA